MGGSETKEIHHYHEDKESKELARQTQEQMETLRGQMEQEKRMQAQTEQRHQEALRRAEELRADEKAAALQRLQQEQENRKKDEERARAELEKQAREAEERLAQELQRQRDNAHKAKLEKWQRLKRDYPIPDFLKNYVNEVSENSAADADRELNVNVALLGDSGTGKSSLIKAILKHFGVDLPAEQMPRISMEGDGTLEPSRFPLAVLGQVSLWDLPGQGTAKIPSLTYLCNMGLKYFDAICIVTDGRWSEGDGTLLAAIHYAGIRCFVVRSKVDLAVDAGAEDKGWSQSKTLSHVHQQLQKQTRLKSHRIHLLTSRERFWKDFGSVDDFATVSSKKCKLLCGMSP
ncbi:Irgc [Symbiodinium sp. CCMP2456]|nr:Irgc [Symbiodinium sp. CCMP2456]